MNTDEGSIANEMKMKIKAEMDCNSERSENSNGKYFLPTTAENSEDDQVKSEIENSNPELMQEATQVDGDLDFLLGTDTDCFSTDDIKSEAQLQLGLNVLLGGEYVVVLLTICAGVFHNGTTMYLLIICCHLPLF